MYRLGPVLVLTLLLWIQPQRISQATDAPALVDRAEVVLLRDYERWVDYGFRREVHRERLDKSGAISWSTDYLFEVSTKASGFDELLIEIDGRTPTAAEVVEHRKAARFQKHYENAGSLRNPFGKEIPLLPLLFDQKHEYVGRRYIRGHPCYKTRFSARNPPPKLPARRRLPYVLSGEACFSIQGDHLVVAEMESARPVSAGIAKLQYLKIRLESEPVGADQWLPTRFEVRSDVRLGMKWLRKSNRYRYSKYRRADS